jgi:DNA polymerase elongation subunit (family B)
MIKNEKKDKRNEYIKMSNQQQHEFYAYSWHIDEECQDETFIRIYGLDDLNRNVCVSVNGFRPFVWVELPDYIKWKSGNSLDALNRHLKSLFPDIRTMLKYRRKLYGANLTKKSSESSPSSVYTHKLYPFLRCSFTKFKNARFHLQNKLRSKLSIQGIGSVKLNVHGQDACPILQLTSKHDLPTAGWISFVGVEVLNVSDRFTSCDREFMVDLENRMFKSSEHISRSNRLKAGVPKPLILSFDLEVNSEDQVTMPKATRPGDAVFQISCVFSRLGSNDYDKYLLSLGEPNEEVVKAKVRSFSTEKKLLIGFRDLVNQMQPNVIIGYNIFNFDIPYLIDRTIYKAIFPEWSQQGFPKGQFGIQREIKWSSSAYKNQQFKFLDCEGRLYIDLLPVVQRDFKLNDYKLKTVSSEFIGETKDDLDPKSIFKCYVEGMKGGERAAKYMSVCGKYCMQDSLLVIKLFEKLNVWYNLSEMAVVCNVPMLTLFTKGQQIKVYSNLYKYCLENNIVPQKDGYLVSDNELYTGAYVFDPKPGLFENVVPEDFSSLYPSLIIAYNIDYTTCAFDPTIPDELCHIMEWWDHVGCEHDPKVIEKRRLTKIVDEMKIRQCTIKDALKESEKKKSLLLRELRALLKIHSSRIRLPRKDKITPQLIEGLSSPGIVVAQRRMLRIFDHIDRLQKEKNDIDTQIKPIRKQRSKITNSKNIICEKRKYRFLKVEGHPEFIGVLPTIVQSLLDARKQTRQEMGRLQEQLREVVDDHERTEMEMNISILNQRQLAYKVSANSMYGITGVKAGMLPFMPVAMSITYMGRTNIMKVADTLKTVYNGEIIAGDTDSCYVSFPFIKSIPQLWDHAVLVANEISKLFPPPMKLEFEEAIYTKFLILTKKRYMYKAALRDGTIKPDIGKRGVLLNRRDNSSCIRRIYEKIVQIVFEDSLQPSPDRRSRFEQVATCFLEDVEAMFACAFPTEDFVITKSTGDYGGTPQYFLNDKGVHRALLGQYNVPFLTDAIKEIEEIDSIEKEREWYLEKLPAHIQLLEKIKRRGLIPNEGSRLEYLIIQTDDFKAKQAAKIETVAYYNKNKDVLKIDHLYYLQRLINPVDQLLFVIFGVEDFTLKLHKQHFLKRKIVAQINKLNAPIFI